MVDQNEKNEKAEKLAELMNDENYELNLDTLEAAAGGYNERRVDTYGDFLW